MKKAVWWVIEIVNHIDGTYLVQETRSDGINSDRKTSLLLDRFNTREDAELYFDILQTAHDKIFNREEE